MLGCSTAPGAAGSLSALFVVGIALLGVIVSRRRGRR
jgi:MYXO-CTERM domain-containing protein